MQLFSVQHAISTACYRYSKIAIDFINYRNPSNNKATGVQCDSDTDNTFCDIYVEVCISDIGAR